MIKICIKIENFTKQIYREKQTSIQFSPTKYTLEKTNNHKKTIENKQHKNKQHKLFRNKLNRFN